MAYYVSDENAIPVNPEIVSCVRKHLVDCFGADNVMATSYSVDTIQIISVHGAHSDYCNDNHDVSSVDNDPTAGCENVCARKFMIECVQNFRNTNDNEVLSAIEYHALRMSYRYFEFIEFKIKLI